MTIDTLEPQAEFGKWQVGFTVEKWFDPKMHELGFEPDEVVFGEYNVLTTPGITRLLSLLGGLGGQAYSNTYGRIGVGNGVTAATSADTDLAGASKLFHGLDASYPSVATNVITFRATFADAEANFAWNEWCIDVGGAGTSATTGTVVSPMLNRRVPATSLGTKTGGVWTLTVTITIT